MAADFKVVIVGSGPAGLSAAAHAAKRGVPHVLLERTDHLNNTIVRYQKRKHVMATPEILPLRSDLDFKEESREEVIDGWIQGAQTAGTNVRFNAEVAAIKGAQGNFQVQLIGGESISTEYVVLAVGVQGNFNRLTVPRADLPFVQYQLDDPDEYKEEKIAIIGVGDAGLENALGLAANNEVYLINRKDEFPGAKSGNRALIMAAIAKDPSEAGSINHVINVEAQEVKAGPAGQPGELILHRADGAEVHLPNHRRIARIGAQPPRRFLEPCGVVFTSADRNAIPQVSETYESGVKGLYIIGALAGYPLIKNCLNQGYEVVEYILGNPIPPADEPLIQAKLSADKIRTLDPAKTAMTGAELITQIQARAPMFSGLKPIQIREFLIHAELHLMQPGEVVFRRGDSTNSLYTVLDGEIGIQIDPANPAEMVRLGSGQFFGEMGLISGRRRTATVVATKPALLLEVDRNTMIRLERSEASIKEAIDSASIIRQIKTFLAPQVDDSLLAEVVASATIVPFKPDEKLIEEDAEDDAVYLIRKG